MTLEQAEKIIDRLVNALGPAGDEVYEMVYEEVMGKPFEYEE